MTRCIVLSAALIAALSLTSCERPGGDDSIYQKDNLLAWCIVPFDSLNRSPQQRADMLRELGISHLAYDWRASHLPTFPEEIAELKAHDIELDAVWIWIERDSSGQWLNGDNEKIFQMVAQSGLTTDFWLGFSNANFEGLTEDQKLEKAVAAVRSLASRASEIGCTVSLYNHGDWFGDPENQVRIIEASGLDNIGIVYNFHHGHDQIDRFPDLLDAMLPYLRTVNLNGMRREGPKILALGQGDSELDMMKALKDSGFRGSIGIIGHVDNEDVAVVLRRNLDGLRALLEEMGDRHAMDSY